MNHYDDVQPDEEGTEVEDTTEDVDPEEDNDELKSEDK